MLRTVIPAKVADARLGAGIQIHQRRNKGGARFPSARE